jgi:hypothetical protein
LFFGLIVHHKINVILQLGEIDNGTSPASASIYSDPFPGIFLFAQVLQQRIAPKRPARLIVKRVRARLVQVPVRDR